MNHTSFDSVIIQQMHDEHVKPAGEIWNKEFQKQINLNNVLPTSWVIDFNHLCLFLEERVKKGRGIVALIEGDMASYMVYDNARAQTQQTSKWKKRESAFLSNY